jgi:hypothetical protein
MTTTNLRKDIEKILLKYGHYHDIMADELEEALKSEYQKGKDDQWKIDLDLMESKKSSILDY